MPGEIPSWALDPSESILARGGLLGPCPPRQIHAGKFFLAPRNQKPDNNGTLATSPVPEHLYGIRAPVAVLVLPGLRVSKGQPAGADARAGSVLQSRAPCKIASLWVCRAVPVPNQPFYRDDHLFVDLRDQVVMLDNETVTLTRKEYRLLALLVEHAGEVVPRAIILTR